jgi:mono/diheme cytochrome c family protein
MLRALIFLLPINLVMLFSLSAWAVESAGDERAQQATALLFEDKCSICHEPDGNAEEEALNLVDDAWLHGGTIADIERTIREGIPGTKMKPHQEKLTPEQIADLAHFVLLLGHPVRDDAGEPLDPSSPGKNRSIPVLITAPESIRIHPPSSTLWGPDVTGQFIVLGQFADMIERDVTGHCKISIDDSSLAEIRDDGRVVPLADGETHITAELGQLKIRAEVKIEGISHQRPFNFQREIQGVLTRRGCNASSCHGGVKGRGGFKLALNAIYPDEDYEWIIKGGGFQVLTDEIKGEQVPRISLAEPEQSLILLKPSLQVDHEGGMRLPKNSGDYQTILEWIRQGAPFTDNHAEDLKIVKLDAWPGEVVLDRNGKHRLLVTATLQDGRKEDVTDQVHFHSNNRDVVKVSRDGIVEAVMPGETDIIIRAAGTSTNARFGVINASITDYPESSGNNYLDDFIFAKLRKFHLLPSPLSGDEDFLRRVCLDLTGALPPPHRVREFLADKDPGKRRKLIDILMETPEFVDYWVYRFSDLFRVRVGGGTNHGELYWNWIRRSIILNKPYDQIARERLSAQGWGGPGRHFMWASKRRPIEALVSEDAQVFLGRRLDCSQCHNHPYETWSQKQFWGLAAFYGKITQTEWVNDQVVYDDPDGQEYDWGELGRLGVEFKQVLNPRTKEEVIPAFLDGSPIDETYRRDPRMALARWMTSHPYFAEAAVNRMWGYFFHRGIVHPVDDFDSTNLPSHPELLQKLAADFREHDHDLRYLIRLIVNSRTYQLSSLSNENNQHDRINFSHQLPRPLDAEVLLDAITSVTGIPVIFDRTKGNVSGIVVGKMPEGTRAVQLRDPVTWPSRFMDIYGRPTRQSVPERNVQPNIEQAMHLLVGDTYTEQLSGEDGRLDQLMKRTSLDIRDIIREFYLAALSRYPIEEELAAIEELMNAQSPIIKQTFFSTNPDRRKVFEDFIWGLISSREFAYNH